MMDFCEVFDPSMLDSGNFEERKSQKVSFKNAEKGCSLCL